MLDVYQEQPRKYPTLQNFLVNANVMIEFVPVTKRENLGSYTLHNDEDVEYDYEENDDTTEEDEDNSEDD